MASPLGPLAGMLPPELVKALEAAVANPTAAGGLPSFGPLAGMLPKELVTALEETAKAASGSATPSFAPLAGLLPAELISSLQGAVGVAQPRAFRFSTPVPIAVATPGGVTRVYTAPMILPSDVTTFVAKAANRDFAELAAGSASVAISVAASDGSGLGWLNPGDPSFDPGAGTIPNDGSFGAIGTLSKRNGTDGITIMLYTYEDQNFAYGQGMGYGQYADGSVMDPVPGPFNPNSQPLYWWNFEYNTTKRRIIVLGDSISVGYNDMYIRSCWMQMAGGNDYAVYVQGIPSVGAYVNYADIASYPYLWDRVVDVLPGSEVVLQLGTNDLALNDFNVMLLSATTVINRLKAAGAARIWAWTIPPQSSYAGTDAVRAQWNTYLKANHVAMGIAGVYDAAAGVSDEGLASDSDPNVLDDTMNSGDGTHPSFAGQTQMMNGYLAVIG